MKNEFTTIGRVLGAFGIKGRVRVSPITDFPERFKPGEIIYIDDKPYIIEENSWHKGNALVKLKGVETTNQAEAFAGKWVEIAPSQERPLPGQYYHYQIVGLGVVTTGGVEVGTVSEVLSAQANDCYVVEGKDGEVLVPATDDVVKSIDLDKKIMTIEPVPGLLDLNKKGNP